MTPDVLCDYFNCVAQIARKTVNTVPTGQTYATIGVVTMATASRVTALANVSTTVTQ